MVHRIDSSRSTNVLELLIENGFDGMAHAMELLINAAMALEREQYLNAKPYERTEARATYANGFKPRAIKTRIGELNLSVPQTRDSKFYPSSLERGMRSERALKLALAQMYVEGVSTRKIAKITEELCGFEISSSQVSKCAALLDEEIKAWREKTLGCYPYVILDARYEKVRHGNHVVSCAVLIAIGINEQGGREVLGVSVSLSEHEVHWRAFLQQLQARGLHGIEMFTSDAHSGLKAALNAVFPSVAWQRCQFHLQQNAQHYVPKKYMKTEVSSDIRAVFNATTKAEAERLLRVVVEKYSVTAPDLSVWMEQNVPESLTVFKLPESQRKKLRTSNPLERVNEEIKRRTRVVRIFPNPESCLRLVAALLMEISEEWQNGKRYLPLPN